MADEQNTEQDVQNPRTPEEQQALDNEMWDAVMELNRLHRPVNFYQDAANYRPAEMAGTEEEIETQRIRLFDVLAKGADINAQKAFDDEEPEEKEGILNYVVDPGLAHDLISYGANPEGALEKHQKLADFHKNLVKNAKDPTEEKFQMDLLKIHQEMADFFKKDEAEKQAYDTYEKLFDKEKGAFEIFGDEKYTGIKIKRNLTDEERSDLIDALVFYGRENEEPLFENKTEAWIEAYKKGLKNTKADTSGIQTDWDLKFGNVFHASFQRYYADEDNWEDENTAVQEENADEETAIDENEAHERTNVADETGPIPAPEADTFGQTNEPDATFREGVDEDTRNLQAPKNSARVSSEEEADVPSSQSNLPERTELHKLADKTNPNDFVWATEQAKNVMDEHPEYIDARSNDGYGVTAMMCAVNKGNMAMLNTLIERHADVNVRNEYGETALMYAAYHGDMVMMKKLIENGADIGVVAGPNSNYAGQDVFGILEANGHTKQLMELMSLTKESMAAQIDQEKSAGQQLRGQAIDPSTSAENAQPDGDLSSLSKEASRLQEDLKKMQSAIAGEETTRNDLLQKLQKMKQKKNSLNPAQVRQGSGR